MAYGPVIVRIDCRVRGLWLVRVLAFVCQLAACVGLPVDIDAAVRLARRMVWLRVRVGSQRWRTIRLDANASTGSY